MKQFITAHDTKKQNIGYAWVLFFIFPIISFIFAIKNYSVKKYRVFIYGFFLFYGFTFLPIPNSDGSRYKDLFEETYTFNNYFNDITEVLNGNSENSDFYHLTLHYVARVISDDSRFYFLIAASVYFFVFLKLIDTIWTIVKKENTKYFISFFIGCCFIYNLSAGVNAIRFPLAFMVFSLGTLKLILTTKKKYLLLAILSVLIHFAFVYSVLFLVIIYLLKFSLKPWVLYTSLILVLSLSFLFSSFIQSNLGTLGSTAQTKFNGYTGEGFLERRGDVRESWNWYISFNLYSTYFFSILSLILTRLNYFKIKSNLISNRLYVFSFFLFIHAILSGSVVDAVTNRYNILFIFFELIYLYHLSSINVNNKLLNFLNYIYIPILIINVLIKVRGDLYTANIIIFFGNFILSFFINEPVSIQDYLLN
jgi:hypothetical protein